MNLELDGKVAIVTGGSRGIGKAIVNALAREGVDVAIVARDMETADATAKEISAATSRKVKAYRADTGDDAETRAATAQIVTDFGRIDILVNAAAQPGGQAPPPKLAEVTSDFFHADVNVKVMGYLRMAREAAPHMIAGGFGRIINISGLAARQTGAIVGSIRNVGVAALTKNLADELGPHGITVNCVHPGLTRTEKTEGVIARMAEKQGVAPDEIERRMASGNSIRRFVTAEQIGDIVAFLASPKSIAINGESIGAGGGAPGAIHY
ncbi:SDR family NAD(P)-dependent oxidoreductase [Terrarubrum flagellatum]|uniref:SDR family NAD(P)-dependent oxidoreductase n=1 Tax=Terrirubrum flagellatum TaxID=2895980 RepID=UPI003145342E